MDLGLVAALAGAAGVGALFAGVALPSRQRRYVTATAPQDQAAGVTVGARTIYDLVAGRKASAEDAELEQLLRAANWYWAPGEPTAPQTVPFYSVNGYHAACLWQAITWGLLGLLAGALAADPLLLVILPVAFAALGYIQPKRKLRAAVAERQHRLVVEMAFRLTELAARVATGRSIIYAFRELTKRPGGPFVTEVARFLRLYDATSSVELAANAVIRYNEFLPLTEFFRAVLLVEQQGGAIAPTLNVQADIAQSNLLRRLQEQGRANSDAMNGPAFMGMFIQIGLLVLAPIVYLLVSSM